MAKVKIIGDYLRKVTNEEGNLEITFCVKDWNYKKSCDSLEKRTYTLELAEIKNKRTGEQNRYFWALVGAIAKEEDGHRSNDMELYGMLLEMANVKSTVITVLSEAVEEFKKSGAIRAVRVIKKEIIKGKEFSACKCFTGSSQFSTKEMKDLIDVTLDYASQIGLDITFYKDVLR